MVFKWLHFLLVIQLWAERFLLWRFFLIAEEASSTYCIHFFFYWVKLWIPGGYAHLVLFKREVKGFCINPKLLLVSRHSAHKCCKVTFLLHSAFECSPERDVVCLNTLCSSNAMEDSQRFGEVPPAKVTLTQLTARQLIIYFLNSPWSSPGWEKSDVFQMKPCLMGI